MGITFSDLADFLGAFAPFGSIDIQETIERGQDHLDLTAEEVGELVRSKAEEFGYEGFDNVDPVAMVNDEIKSRANQNWNDLTSKIDWENISYENHENGEDELTDAIEDVYYFSNYIDCPLQYEQKHKEAAEFFMQLVEDDIINKEEIEKPLRFVLSEMGIEVED